MQSCSFSALSLFSALTYFELVFLFRFQWTWLNTWPGPHLWNSPKSLTLQVVAGQETHYPSVAPSPFLGLDWGRKTAGHLLSFGHRTLTDRKEKPHPEDFSLCDCSCIKYLWELWYNSNMQTKPDCRHKPAGRLEAGGASSANVSHIQQTTDIGYIHIAHSWNLNMRNKLVLL